METKGKNKTYKIELEINRKDFWKAYEYVKDIDSLLIKNKAIPAKDIHSLLSLFNIKGEVKTKVMQIKLDDIKEKVKKRLYKDVGFNFIVKAAKGKGECNFASLLNYIFMDFPMDVLEKKEKQPYLKFIFTRIEDYFDKYTYSINNLDKVFPKYKRDILIGYTLLYSNLTVSKELKPSTFLVDAIKNQDISLALKKTTTELLKKRKIKIQQEIPDLKSARFQFPKE
ncbi:MAG: hypothetical protein Q8T03_02795 [Bacteroidota bacterium]|nr:hypothetical protein [Bacteroidota bacterium]